MAIEDLKNKIKAVIRKKLERGEIDFPGEGEQTIPQKFPTVEDALIQLMTDQYPLFVEDIFWVAPKPTTFRILLKNDQAIFIVRIGDTWTVEVEGKKYDLSTIQGEQRGCEAVARVLRYGQTKQAGAAEGGETLPPPEETPAEEPTPEETTPPPGI